MKKFPFLCVYLYTVPNLFSGEPIIRNEPKNTNLIKKSEKNFPPDIRYSGN
jgi:hypothetical protein